MIHYSCAHLWPLGSLRLWVAGDNQRTFYRFSLSSKTIELERVTCRTQGFPGMGDKLVNQTLGWSVLTCWQVACDNDLAAGIDFRFLQDWLYCNYNWINITRSGLALSHAALTFHECQRVSPLTSLGHCAAKRLHPTASPRFPCRPPVLPPGCFAWGQTPELTPFNILELINIRIAKFDKWCFNVWKPFSHSSHWLTGIQEESPPQMSKTQLQNLLFQQNVLRWSWQTHAKSPLLNFKETLKRGTRYITSIEIWKSHTH